MTISQEMARKIRKLYPNDCKIVKIKMLYGREVGKYIREIEEAHNKTAKSKLHFP